MRDAREDSQGFVIYPFDEKQLLHTGPRVATRLFQHVAPLHSRGLLSQGAATRRATLLCVPTTRESEEHDSALAGDPRYSERASEFATRLISLFRVFYPAPLRDEYMGQALKCDALHPGKSSSCHDHLSTRIVRLRQQIYERLNDEVLFVLDSLARKLSRNIND